ncbi:MAG: DUF6600 domain-containing protein [Bryobacteraceae bacterium]|jgi:hypothetical protein
MPRTTFQAVKSVLILATLCALFACAVCAQDPPSRVARLNYIGGRVSMEPAGTDDWSPAVVNRPFTTGDYLWTEDGARAELHLDNAVLRLDARSSFGFLNLDDHVTQIKLSQGELFVRARRLNQDESFEVDTPNAAVNILRDGEYLFRVDGDSHVATVIVRDGQADVTDGGQAFTLHAGESAQLSGVESPAYDLQSAPAHDGFERWCEDRDSREARSASARYLPPEVVGYEDLDSYGSWRDVPEYGPVWFPSVASGWAPYRYGHWTWIDPWGWTWVDDAPWGFAPFHYGRWAFFAGAWCWAPGPLVVVSGGPPMVRVRPVYSPASVAFVGGSNWGVSISAGGGPAVGWVPLGPGELFTPAYRVSHNYFQNVNLSNTRIHNTVEITNVYNTTYVNNTVVHDRVVNRRFVNMTAPNAVTAMPHDAFASGRSVAQAGMPLRGNDLERIRSAPAVVGPGVAPTRQALAPVRGSGPVAQPPDRVVNTRVVGRTPPPPRQPSSSGFRRQSETPTVTVTPPARQLPDQPRRVEPVDRSRPAQIQTYPVQPAPNQPPRVEPAVRPQPAPDLRTLPAPVPRSTPTVRPQEQRSEPRTEQQHRSEQQAAPVRQEHRSEPKAAPVRQERHAAKPPAKPEEKKEKDK